MAKPIEVQVFQAALLVEGKRVRLTKTIARQFPILDGRKRWDAAVVGEPQPEPICKVAGKVLGTSYTWMYLVEDAEAGLGWVAATQMSEAVVTHHDADN
jgi:hypothetical protein